MTKVIFDRNKLDNISEKTNSKVKISFWTKILFIMSSTALTILLSSPNKLQFIIISILVSFICNHFLYFKFNILEKIIENIDKVTFITSFIFSFISLIEFSHYYNESFFPFFKSILSAIGTADSTMQTVQNFFPYYIAFLAAISSMSVFVYYCAFISKFRQVTKKFILSLEKVDRYYFIVSIIILSIAIITIYSLTNVFYGPEINSKLVKCDVIYTSDSPFLVKSNTYLNIGGVENDLRQPLFGVFSAPFACCAMIISKLLFFVPNIYPVSMNIIQIALLLVSFIMLAKLIKLNNVSKLFFLIIITITYPSLLFMLNMEQYIFSTFWLITLIYAQLNNEPNKDYYFIATTGSMLTSGIAFPLITNEKNIVSWIKEIFNTAIKFFVITTLFGKLPLFLNAINEIKKLLCFTGIKVETYDKFIQFTNFISSCFITPNADIDTTTFKHISYQLQFSDSINYIGIIFGLIAVLGFLLNYKNKFAKISFVWILYSFVLLFFVGWGTQENGLILYSLYFGWAYISLTFMFIEKAFRKFKILQYSIYTISIATLLYINIPGIYEIINFGINYYPVR